MQVGKPLREVYIEPLEMPEPLRTTPSEEPTYEPQEVPDEQPAFTEKE